MVHNFGLWRQLFGFNAALIVGQRGTGKSTLLSALCQKALKKGMTVYSNYPIDGALTMPKLYDKYGKAYLDKSFLYHSGLHDCMILIDEVANVWNNRAWGKWTDDDSDFFNYLRKNKIYLVMACQYYDMIDLNIKRAVETVWFLSHSLFPNVTLIDIDIQHVVKVEDSMKRVIDTRYNAVTYQPCVANIGCWRFRRRPWYKYFLTYYKEQGSGRVFDVQPWRNLMLFGDGSDKPETETAEDSEPTTDTAENEPPQGG